MSLIVGLGEILLRISSEPGQSWLQSPTAALRVGGAECNVLSALAHWQHRTRLLSALPNHTLGDAVLRQLRGFGIALEQVQRNSARLGVYYLDPGVVQRPPRVIYDREHSAFTELNAESFDWDQVFHSAQVFHVSGISPALGASSLALTLRAVREARARKVSISFDCNYRQALWQRWHQDARPALRELLQQTDFLFADSRDLALCFDLTPPEVSGKVSAKSLVELPRQDEIAARLEWTRGAAFARLPQLKMLAHTVRVIHQVDHQQVQSCLATRAGFWLSEVSDLRSIVDRVGTGDAFAAGVLHGTDAAWSSPQVLAFAHAAFCLKHAMQGDVLIATDAEVQALADGVGFQIQR